MNPKYELVLGMEIHMQLGTKMKMFCSCKSDPFYSDPNTNLCPTCLGLPGAMPQVNEQALEFAQRMAFALGGNLRKEIIFERKNYFYPDLAKSFQLTCPHYPISERGEFDMTYHGIKNPIRWREIHLEEDTAKSSHSDMTYIDFNKSGVPLLEMVTEPDFVSIDDAVLFCKEIQMIARTLDISDADMEKGNMRLEANISVRKKGETELPNYRVELKNINSFGFMKKALEHELRRQTEELEKGNQLFQETRGYDENKKKTFVQRSKEEANDYRYFPEPDIPPILFGEEYIGHITTSISEFLLPMEFRIKLEKLGIKKNYIDTLLSDYIWGDGSKYKKLNELILNYSYDPIKASVLVIDNPSYKDLSAQEIKEKEDKKRNELITDTDKIEQMVQEVIKNNDKVVEDYRNGKDNALQFLLGQVMRISGGKVDVKTARDILLTKITS